MSRGIIHRPLRPFVYLWASPGTLLGLAVGLFGLMTGGRVRRVGPVLEFYGGGAQWLLSRCVGGPGAMTLGHVVIGCNGVFLDVAREHEMIHVRQYERWGPLFIPAYLLCSAWLWLRGKDPYRENPFERQAYEKAP